MSDDELKAEFSNNLLALLDMTQPLLDAADGLRAEMERRGWSPTAAEQVALGWLINAQTFAWKTP